MSPSSPWFDSKCSKKNFRGKIIHVAEVNQQCWLGESGQWLENVDWTHPYLVIWLVASQYYKTRLCLKLPNVSSDIYFISLCLRPHLLTLLMHQASWVTLRNTVDKVGAVSCLFGLLIGLCNDTKGDLFGGKQSSSTNQVLAFLNQSYWLPHSS